MHDAGGLVYMDGANMNAMVGVARPGDLGTDILHFNLHKTFSVPHGGGGPGAGATAVTAELAPYPAAAGGMRRDGDTYRHDYRLPALDRPGACLLRQRQQRGARLRLPALPRWRRTVRHEPARGVECQLPARRPRRRALELPYPRICKHEVVFSARRQAQQHGVRTLDLAKRLIDYGIHPPTIYFPLTVAEALMVEPTETESKHTLDQFIAALRAILAEAAATPELVRSAPHSTPVGRLDEVAAARRPVLVWPPDTRSRDAIDAIDSAACGGIVSRSVSVVTPRGPRRITPGLR